jgi:hypothetical protein
MLSPAATSVEAIEVVSASLLRRSVQDRSFRNEPFVAKVVVHVNALIDFHDIDKLISAPLVRNSGDPVSPLGA